jgi:hypothetical protein
MRRTTEVSSGFAAIATASALLVPPSSPRLGHRPTITENGAAAVETWQAGLTAARLTISS